MQAIRADKTGAVQYNFDWELSGHRAVAPVQVFDDGRKTWLQFPPQQPVPAIFADSAQGGRPLAYTREGPYVVLQGVWPVLILRGGHLKSTIRRPERVKAAAGPEPGADALAVVPSAALAPAVSTLPVSPANSVSPARQAEIPASVPTATPNSAKAERKDLAAGPAGRVLVEAPSPALATALTAASFDLSDAVPAGGYQVSPQDVTLRSALVRWARQGGWTFEPEHWAIDADIPIVGTASFEADFKLAVRELVASTELSDRPAQPCFYSNQVLRIVPYAQPCDRTVGATRPS
ncbi:TcpQ domain-containing protein [Pollutimonas sp. H1-120]|uniref:TcpQ domain-containing protein n=1 Tax=Pollutimonas sp. H1-120 TaxID=3148824 RepID=UPI003B529CC9